LTKHITKKGELLLSEIADDVDFIKLQTTKDNYFYSPSNIKIVNGRIYFFDRKLGQFFIFNIDGNFISKFGTKGKGPNEYVEIQDFSYNNYRNVLTAFTRENKVLTYDLDGKLLKSCNLKSSPLHLIPFSSGYIGYYPSPICIGNNGNQLSTFNESGKHLESFAKNESCEKRDAVLFHQIYLHQNEIRFWDCSIDTVFSLNSQLQVNPVYSFCSIHAMPKNLFSSINSFQAGAREYLTIQNLFESIGYLFIRGRIGSYGTGLYLVYDKRNNRSFVLQDNDLKKVGIKDNLVSTLFFWPNDIVNDGRMACFFEIIDLKERLKESGDKMNLKYSNKFKALKALIENSDSNDNPILFLIKLKNGDKD